MQRTSDWALLAAMPMCPCWRYLPIPPSVFSAMTEVPARLLTTPSPNGRVTVPQQCNPYNRSVGEYFRLQKEELRNNFL